MKFTIKVETDETNTIIKAVAKAKGNTFILNKAVVPYLPGESWLVFDEKDRERMIVLSQVNY